MKRSSLGLRIQTLRKQNSMTQKALAEQIGVTDKAVSKWERGLSCPDINLIPKLAKILGTDVCDLMQVDGGSSDSERLAEIFGMTHDFHTPLIAILSYTNLAQNHMDDKAALEKYLHNIEVSGKYLLANINKLMSLVQPGEVSDGDSEADLGGDSLRSN